jgi:uncharacterized protein (TIGR02145 family)
MNAPDLSVINPATQLATVYQGVAATLLVSITNNTGADVTLSSSAQASSLEIFMPPFFSFAEVQMMEIAQDGWTFSVNTTDQALMLTFAGPGGTAWSAGTAISFTITGVEATAKPSSNVVQINPSNMSGNVPLTIQAPLSLLAAPQPGTASLTDTLRVSLENDGTVYVSQAGDPLSNSLFLNFENIGASPLYSGDQLWTGKPQAIVSFVYGQTAGSLAQDADQSSPGVGSAWNIVASIPIDEGNAWKANNPQASGASGHPSWILEPVATNKGIIGAGDHANIKFQFGQIISLTPVGNTQMTVHFTGFRRDEHTAYDDHVFILNITKLAPSTRGVLTFFSPNSSVTVRDPNAKVDFPFRWSMFQVDQVILSWPDGTLVTRNYPGTSGAPPQLGYDHATVSLDYAAILNVLGTIRSENVVFTLKSLDSFGGQLNSQQFIVSVNGKWGALNLSSSLSQVTVFDRSKSLELTLSWSMFETAKVKLYWSVGSALPVLYKTVTYPFPPQLSARDQTLVSLPFAAIVAAMGSQTSGAVVFTLQSFDVDGNARLSPTCSVAVSCEFFLDPRDQKAYSTMVVGKTLWMTQNLDWNSGDSNSVFFNHDSSHEVPYGRLYTESAADQAPPGWRLPSREDWYHLFAAYEHKTRGGFYTTKSILAGGSSGFNAQFGGTLWPFGFTGLGGSGFYWVAGNQYLIIDAEAAAVFPFPKRSSTDVASVRYVKDL